MNIAKQSGGGLRKIAGFWIALGVALAGSGVAQNKQQADERGPTFSISDVQIQLPLSFVVYGDQRFTRILFDGLFDLLVGGEPANAGD